MFGYMSALARQDYLEVISQMRMEDFIYYEGWMNGKEDIY